MGFEIWGFVEIWDLEVGISGEDGDFAKRDLPPLEDHFFRQV